MAPRKTARARNRRAPEPKNEPNDTRLVAVSSMADLPSVVRQAMLKELLLLESPE